MSEDIIPNSAWLLMDAKELILSEDDWGQGEYEKDGCLCMVGALRVASYGTDSVETLGAGSPRVIILTEAYAALNNLFIEHISPSEYNDMSSHSEVMHAFDCAIANEIGRVNGREPNMFPSIKGIQ